MKKMILLFVISFMVVIYSQPTIDGNLSDTEYTVIAVGSNRNAWGSVSVDTIKYYADVTNNMLYLGVVGELPTDKSDGIGIWLDLSQETGYTSGTVLGGTSGVGHYLGNADNPNFKADFEVDYMFAINTGSDSTHCYVDAVKLIDTKAAQYLGDCEQSGTFATNSSINFWAQGIVTFAFNNDRKANHGFEIRIPFSQLGSNVTSSGTISVFAFVVSNTAYFSKNTAPGTLPSDSDPGFNPNFAALSVGPFHTSSWTLPVELTSFTAFAGKDGVELNWTTATEVNNYGFEIERCDVGQASASQWEKIGFVQGHGNSNSPKDYTFTDTDAKYGTYDYRLKQIDFSGTYLYSETVSVNTGASLEKLTMDIYPNPFNPSTTISFVLPKSSHVNLYIYDITGQKVAELIDNEFMESGYHKLTFNAGHLASGIYISVIQTEGMQVVKKMQLLK